MTNMFLFAGSGECVSWSWRVAYSNPSCQHSFARSQTERTAVRKGTCLENSFLLVVLNAYSMCLFCWELTVILYLKLYNVLLLSYYSQRQTKKEETYRVSYHHQKTLECANLWVTAKICFFSESTSVSVFIALSVPSSTLSIDELNLSHNLSIRINVKEKMSDSY